VFLRRSKDFGRFRNCGLHFTLSRIHTIVLVYRSRFYTELFNSDATVVAIWVTLCKWIYNGLTIIVPLLIDLCLPPLGTLLLVGSREESTDRVVVRVVLNK